jgi:hypothetical protein
MVEDLAALGTRDEQGLRYTSQNRDTPGGLAEALQPGSACEFRAVHQRLFRYTLATTAALRVSTNNPGTSSGFDSTLFVVRAPCTLPPAVLACNDDDPFAPRDPHVVASLLTTPVLPAGTTVLIAVSGFYPAYGSGQEPAPGGETGSFELTVREMSPLAPDATCDLRGAADVCAEGYHCVPATLGGDVGACRADGASPGARCRGDGSCAEGLSCDRDAGICFATVSAGARCDRITGARERCGAGLSCVSRVRGALRGTCVADGSAPLAACVPGDGGDTCAEGLACRGGICARPVASGGACSTVDSLCAAGESCVPLAPGAVAGRCVPNGSVAGAACRDDSSECDAPLFCILTRWVDRVCRTVGRAPGEPCGALGACAYDTECVVFDPTQPYRGACTPAGSEGGVCRTAGIPCDTGLACSDPTPARGRCLRRAGTGEACDPPGKRVRCASGTTCVREGTSGICRAHGTVAGAACRSAGARCDAGLSCTTPSGPGICQRDPVDDTCDPRFATVRCPTGQVCRATGLEAGTCAAASTEVEPNDAAPASSAVPVPAAMAGALERFDVDCVGVDVPAGGAVFAQAVAPDGSCTANLAVDLYDPRGELLGGDTDSGPGSCPRIEGADASAFPWARALQAGRYTVCVREAGDRRVVPAYVLSVNAE